MRLPASVIAKSFAQLLAIKILEGEAVVTSVANHDTSPTSLEVGASFTLTTRLFRAEAEKYLTGLSPEPPELTLVDFIVAASHSLQLSICEDECVDDFTVAERMMGWWAERAQMAQEAAAKKAL